MHSDHPDHDAVSQPPEGEPAVVGDPTATPAEDATPTDPWGWRVDSEGNPVPPDAATAALAGVAAPDAAGGETGPRRHAKSGGWSGRRMALVGGAAVVVLAAIGVGGFMLASGASPKKQAASTTSTTHPTTTTVVHVAAKVHHAPTCPLTGLPAPGGKVPQRPVLAVKVGNDPAARPQSGLEHTDIVFDTLAEGGITRYIAVYQCNNAPNIGPVRSVRWDDWHILQMFGRADLAFVHGIDPDVNTVASLPWVCDLDAFAHFNLYTTDPDRVAPEATYTSTAALWGACPKGPAPPPIFKFSAKPPATAHRVAAAALDYSGEADAVWEWSAKQQAFLHFYNYGSGPVADLDDQGNQLQAKNVVVELVNLQYGQYEETPGSTGDVESQTIGSGTAYVLRNGTIQKGTWVRPAWTDIPQLLGPGGKPMTLTPGNTWVEIFPDTDALTFTP